MGIAGGYLCPPSRVVFADHLRPGVGISVGMSSVQDLYAVDIKIEYPLSEAVHIEAERMRSYGHSPLGPYEIQGFLDGETFWDILVQPEADYLPFAGIYLRPYDDVYPVKPGSVILGAHASLDGVMVRDADDAVTILHRTVHLFLGSGNGLREFQRLVFGGSREISMNVCVRSGAHCFSK